MTMKIVDVSSAQAKYKFGTINEDGVICKATDNDYINPYCDYVAQQAIRKKAPLGVYHFAYVGKSAASQARYFYENTKGYYKYGAIPILDFEIPESYCNQAARVKFITDFSHEFKKLTNHNIMVYGGVEVVKAAKQNKLPLWFAYYPYPTLEASEATWITPRLTTNVGYPLTMWQFTTSHNKLDRSIFYGSRKQWNKLAYKK